MLKMNADRVRTGTSEVVCSLNLRGTAYALLPWWTCFFPLPAHAALGSGAKTLSCISLAYPREARSDFEATMLMILRLRTLAAHYEWMGKKSPSQNMLQLAMLIVFPKPHPSPSSPPFPTLSSQSSFPSIHASTVNANIRPIANVAYQ